MPPANARNTQRMASRACAWHRLRRSIEDLRQATPAVRHRLIIAALLMPAGVGWVAPAEAVPITYTESAIASGTLGGTAFSDALVTVTLKADTTGVAAGSYSGVHLVVNPGAATLSIEGLGTAAFNSPNGYTASLIRSPNPWFASTGFIIAQFDRPSHDVSDGLTHILGLDDGALAGYGLRGAFGSLTGKGIGVADDWFPTTRGLLIMNSGAEVVTFTATVPEPSSAAMLALGAMALLVTVRRRRR
jgi:hypothetical protein